MLQHYRMVLASSLLAHGPLIRLCLRLLFMLFFAVFFLSLLHSVSEIASGSLWNPFKEKRTRKVERHEGWPSNLPPQDDDDEILNMDPKYPRTRDWLYDHIYFSFYDGARVYTNQEYIGGTVSRKPHFEEQAMLNQLQARALKFLNHQYPEKYSKELCNSVKYRTIPTVGIEADVTCNDTKTGSVDRLSLLMKIKPPKVIYHHAMGPTTSSVNIIMPLRGRVDSLKLFLKNLVDILRDNPNHVDLTVVYFEDGNVKEVRQVLQDVEASTHNLKTQFILLEGLDTIFSRGRGLQVGVDRTTLRANVMFFCDVDALFTKDFLTRCQSTPVQGHRIYIPMVFSLYNPQFVYPLHKHRIPSPLLQLNVKDDFGYWRVWGHGMVCLYKSDFHEIGGFDQERTGWGGEDLAFVRKTINNGNYKIIRSLDPGLFHMYHGKECNDAGKYYACLKMKASNEASKQTLGFWYFKQTEKVSVYGALVEGNQPHYHDDYDTDPKEIDKAKSDETIRTQLVSKYMGLWEMLFALVLIAVLGLDIFLMIQNFRYEKRGIPIK